MHCENCFKYLLPNAIFIKPHHLLTSGIELIALDNQEYEENWPEEKMQEKKGQKAQKTSNKHGKEAESSCSGIHNRLAIAKETEQVNTHMY